MNDYSSLSVKELTALSEKLDSKRAALDNKQMAIKILMNSLN
jgi:DNA polymerase elongation subunit (family B)